MIQVVDGKVTGWRSEVRNLLASLPREAGGCFEHDPRWLDVLHQGLNHRTFALLAYDPSPPTSPSESAGSPSRRLLGYLPVALVQSRLFGRFLVSLPYLNRAGIVATDEHIRKELLDAAVALAARHQVQYLELRHHAHTMTDRAITRNRDDKALMVLDLCADADALWTGLNAKVRNQIRKGDKAGLSIRWGGLDNLGEFYDVFSVNMRDLGTPVYPRRLFKSILTHFTGEAELAVVQCAGRAVAGALLIHDPVHGTQVPSASCLRAFNHTSANMWMYHQLLGRAIQRGSRAFDFGRSSPESGTFKFKKQWGASPRPTTWQYHLRRGEVDALRPEHPKMQRRIAAWQKLPVWVTRVVGPTIVRGIP